MRKICVATGSRTDYGHMYWLMKDIQADGELELQILVTGQHLSETFGNTIHNFEPDGFVVSALADSYLVDSTPYGVCGSFAATHYAAATELRRLKPDILVLAGDRSEMLAIATAAHILKIPLAHIHGGESTEGMLLEGFRHCITKLSSLHFVAAEPYRKTVIQMGESPDTVFCFGSPALDHIQRTETMPAEQLAQILIFPLDVPYCILVYHAEVLSREDQSQQFTFLVETLLKETNLNILISKPDTAIEDHPLRELAVRFAANYPARVLAFDTLGQKGFYTLIRGAQFVIGNSSSGIIDVPALGVVTINVGDRQKGRLRAKSVIQCGLNEKSIKIALSDVKRAKELTIRGLSPYGKGNACGQIKDVLKAVNLDHILIKKFYRLEAQTS